MVTGEDLASVEEKRKFIAETEAKVLDSDVQIAENVDTARKGGTVVGATVPSSTEVKPVNLPDQKCTPFADLKFRHPGIGKALLQRHARRVLSLRSSGGLTPLFRAVAQHLGATWAAGIENKRDGYKLLARLYDETPEWQEPLKVSKAPTRKGTSYLPRKKKTPIPAVATDEFLSSYAWRRLRMEVLIEQGRRCQCCGATPSDGAVMHVDHIKPRRLFPELALEKSNLQVLCGVCNHGKGNWDQTNWREEPPPPERVLPMWSKRVN